MTQERLFRKKSLARLQSPEDLEQLIHVITPQGWLGILFLALLILVALAWGVLGRITETVPGTGILVLPSGMANLQAQEGGKVEKVYVQPGDEIKKGNVIAKIMQMPLLSEIRETQAKRDEIRAQEKEFNAFVLKDLRLQKDFYLKQKANLHEIIASAQKQLKQLETILLSQQKLLEKGLIVEQKLLATQKEYETTKESIESSKARLKSIEVDKHKLQQQHHDEQRTLQQRRRELERKISDVQLQLEESAWVRSKHNGKVLEVNILDGDHVQPGEVLATLEKSDDPAANLRAAIYVQAAEGKKIKQGMQVKVAPSIVKKEEYGFILGRVKSVSDFPASKKRMMMVLQNELLVQQLSANGSLFEVMVDLTRDPRTPSGLQWTSLQGPPTKVSTGTLCVARIITGQKKPVSMALPYLKEELGMAP